MSIGLFVRVKHPQGYRMNFRTFKLAAKKSGSDRILTHLVGLLPAVAGDQVLDLLLHVEDEAAAAETEGGNSPNPL